MAIYLLASSWLLVFAAAFISRVGSDSGSGASGLLGNEGEEGISEPESYCPGYRPGNPGLVPDIQDCKRGVEIGVVDHRRAFGINSLIKNPNWTACGIPVVPGEK